MSEVVARQLQSTSSNIILNNIDGILQVVQSVKTDTQSISGGSAPAYGLALVTGLSVTISKTSISSKMLVIVDMRGAGTGSYNRQEWVLMRNGEPCFIGQGQDQVDYQNSVATNQCTGRFPVNAGATGTNICSTGCWFFDTEIQELQDTITYAVYGGDRNGDSSVFINRNNSSTTGGGDTVCASSITVLEIA